MPSHTHSREPIRRYDTVHVGRTDRDRMRVSGIEHRLEGIDRAGADVAEHHAQCAHHDRRPHHLMCARAPNVLLPSRHRKSIPRRRIAGYRRASHQACDARAGCR